MVVRLSALRTGRPLPPRKIPGTHFCYRLSRPQGHSAAGRIDTVNWKIHFIGTRTRDIPACSLRGMDEKKLFTFLVMACLMCSCWSTGSQLKYVDLCRPPFRYCHNEIAWQHGRWIKHVEWSSRGRISGTISECLWRTQQTLFMTAGLRADTWSKDLPSSNHDIRQLRIWNSDIK
jgi:hypothetical protein